MNHTHSHEHPGPGHRPQPSAERAKDPCCGMAPEPELPVTSTEWVCPMHPEIVRSEPGSCPICGMALEPRTAALDEPNPELRDMSRRFWISVALTAPLLVATMGEMVGLTFSRWLSARSLVW